MRILLVLLVLIGKPLMASAALVLTEKATGKLIEYQSDATPGTLLKNITDNPQYGYTEAQVEEQAVSPEEWTALKEKWIDAPAREDAKKTAPASVPIEDFAGGAAGGALAVLLGKGYTVMVERKKKDDA